MLVQDGQTALYNASKNGHIPIVEFLLQAAEADVRIYQKVRDSDSPCVIQLGKQEQAHL